MTAFETHQTDTPQPQICPQNRGLSRQRRATRVWNEESARALLSAAPVYSLATRRADLDPVLRHLNGVLLDDWLLFHGAFAGEKMDCLDQPAVVSAYCEVATIPSYFVDPILACPATTYFKSAMGHGVLRAVEHPDLKARMLQALMEKYQPEGGHAHFVESKDVYKKELRAVRVFGVQLQQITGKCNLGHDRPTERTRAVVRGLFARGKEGDCKAIETILEFSPVARPDEWTRTVHGHVYSAHIYPSPDLERQHAQLLVGQYWRKNSSCEHMRAAIASSQAWVGIVDEEGTLLAAGRAVADRHWVATICDVIVRLEDRRVGLGTWLMELLLAQPAVSGCVAQRLGTTDTSTFYERLGFHVVEPDVSGPKWMVRRSSDVQTSSR